MFVVNGFLVGIAVGGKQVSHAAVRLSHRLPNSEPEAEAVASQKRRKTTLRLLGGSLSDVSGFSWRVAAQADVSSPMADACQANRGWLIEHKISSGQSEQCRPAGLFSVANPDVY